MILLIIVIGLAIVLAYTFLQLRRMQSDFRKLMSNVKGGNLAEIWQQHLDRIDTVSMQQKSLEKNLQKVEESTRKYLYKIGFKRYNPFHETGGDQSFVLAMLNKKNNGVLLSSLHQRDLTRVYAKLVGDGKCSHKLSDEEQKILDETVQQNGN